MDENKPRHIGIILDGNRRFAKKLNLNPLSGHQKGAETVENLLKWSLEFGIKELTLYSFSTENFNRPKIEVDYLLNLMGKKFDELSAKAELAENKVRINFIGRTEMFPKELQDKMFNLSEKTKGYDNLVINFAMAYGGRYEIIDAMKKIAEKIESKKLSSSDINEHLVSENMYMNSDIDLVIRTSEQRLSGFMTWQSVYSEILFLPDMLWPEFTKDKFEKCLEEYSNRKRRFGK